MTDYDGYKEAVERIQYDSFFNTTKGKNVTPKSLSTESIKAALSTKTTSLQLTNGGPNSSTRSSSLNNTTRTNVAASSMRLPAINN